MIEVLKDIESNGIDILDDKEYYKVHFVLGLVIGDNSGLNEFFLGSTHHFLINSILKALLLQLYTTEGCFHDDHGGRDE